MWTQRIKRRLDAAAEQRHETLDHSSDPDRRLHRPEAQVGTKYLLVSGKTDERDCSLWNIVVQHQTGTLSPPWLLDRSRLQLSGLQRE
ncbi:hypothetical protein ILYODFUR_013991 [Ilyodon furcidens]|uniref:Uncharacterized protein n=1 Tax=Ilyodon furcidens TaxID=33524 RepID=A0ABV0URS7_9TELE